MGILTRYCQPDFLIHCLSIGNAPSCGMGLPRRLIERLRRDGSRGIWQNLPTPTHPSTRTITMTMEVLFLGIALLALAYARSRTGWRNRSKGYPVSTGRRGWPFSGKLLASPLCWVLNGRRTSSVVKSCVGLSASMFEANGPARCDTIYINGTGWSIIVLNKKGIADAVFDGNSLVFSSS